MDEYNKKLKANGLQEIKVESVGTNTMKSFDNTTNLREKINIDNLHCNISTSEDFNNFCSGLANLVNAGIIKPGTARKLLNIEEQEEHQVELTSNQDENIKFQNNSEDNLAITDLIKRNLTDEGLKASVIIYGKEYTVFYPNEILNALIPLSTKTITEDLRKEYYRLNKQKTMK